MGGCHWVSTWWGKALATLKPFNGPIGRWWHSGCPPAKHEASGWWDVPPGFSRLDPTVFLFYTDASGLKDFCAVRQEKTLALAQVLQICAEESGVPTGILCELEWELQKWMAPLMTLCGDDIVKASLLKPIGEEHRTPLLSGGRSHSPRWGNQTATSSRFSPRMTRNWNTTPSASSPQLHTQT